jgi:hypothetical protein
MHGTAVRAEFDMVLPDCQADKGKEHEVIVEKEGGDGAAFCFEGVAEAAIERLIQLVFLQSKRSTIGLDITEHGAFSLLFLVIVS